MEVIVRLLTGWWSFLQHHIVPLRPDPDLWIPTVAALLLCLVALFLTARRIRVPHPFSAALSFILLLPVLFATAFLIPGIILQLQLLASGH
ncbi:hypothetical protein llg_31920 [Luteolibacter sp. LG18]|nr:hypothetical protein llg_31920 [Luteolibacter sp. LG18]